MKNIHVLKTNKPSRLIQAEDDELMLLNELYENTYNINKHIYITSDERPNTNEYYIIDGIHEVLKNDSLKFIDNNCKKIILTTDQDLIKNGVQEIDDEFLEWFINNSSCESVKVEIICGVCGVEGREDEIDVCGRSKECARGWISDKYKIIIPRKIIQIYKINDLKEAFLKGYVAKNNKEDYPFAVQKFLNSKLNENKK